MTKKRPARATEMAVHPITMINVTKLYCGLEQPADAFRYGQGHGAARTAAERRPIVVWNITRRCNLQCIHCYSDSDARNYPGENRTYMFGDYYFLEAMLRYSRLPS